MSKKRERTQLSLDLSWSKSTKQPTEYAVTKEHTPTATVHSLSDRRSERERSEVARHVRAILDLTRHFK